MKPAPSVSIVTPIYGVEKYIARCAHSLFQQTYGNIHYVFVNDCTNDDSINVLKEVIECYKDRKGQCIIIDHECNQGLAAARYTGLLHVDSDYIMHVDSDDFLEPDAVETLVKEAIRSNSDIVIGGSFHVYSDRKIQGMPYKHLDKDSLIKNILLLKASPSVWGKLYSSALYKDGNDTFPIRGINHGEDFATVPRLLHYAESISYVDKALYNYVQSNNSSYTNNFTVRSVKDMVGATDKLLDFFHDKLTSETLDLCAVRVKLAMLKRMNTDVYDIIRNLYPDESRRAFKQLSFTDRVLLRLVNLSLYKAAVIFIRLGLRLKTHQKS